MRRTALFLSCFALAGASLDAQQGVSSLGTIAPAPPEAACAHSALACGASVTGSIDETDCKIANGSYDDTYKIEVPGKRLLTIQMESPDFDSFLTLRDEPAMKPIPAYSNGPLAVIVHDDNSGGGKSAQVEVGTDSPGSWFVTARGKKGRSRGTYTLTVKCEDLTCEPNPPGICLNRMRFRVVAQYTDTKDWAFGGAGSRDKATFHYSGPPVGRRGSAEVSVIDHCAESGHFWVSANASVDGPFRITITDTRTGAKKVYETKDGEVFQPVEDRQSFPCP